MTTQQTTRPATRQDSLTADQQVSVSALLQKSESILAAAVSDIDPNGGFYPTAWVVTPGRVLTVSLHANGPSISLETPLSSIESFYVRHMRGLLRLEVLTRNTCIPMACYTHVRKNAFEKTMELARPLLTAGVLPESDNANASNGHRRGKVRGDGQIEECPTCGLPIPPRFGCCPQCLDHKKLIVRLLGRTRKYFVPMSGAFVLMFMVTTLEMGPPILQKIFLDDVFPNKDMRLFFWVLFGYVSLSILNPLLSGLRGYVMGWLGERMVHDLRTEVYDHLQSLSMDFYDQHQTGWIMDRVSADTNNIQNFVAEGLQDLIRDCMTLLIIIGVMFVTNPHLALISLFPAPFVFFMTRHFARRFHRQFHGIWRKRARMTSLLSNVIPGTRVVRAFAQESHERERFHDRSRTYMDAQITANRTGALFNPLMGFVTSLGGILVWGVGGHEAMTGTLTVGTLFLFLNYLWRFYGPMNNLGAFSRRVERATTSAQRIFDVLDARPTVKEPENHQTLPTLSGRLEFENVSFGYETDEPVLKDVSFTVEPGEMIGLVGPSGAGKSTTINLLCRFYDATEGAVKVDGIDVRSVTLHSLRSQIGVVLQDPFLFYGTIADNIAYGNPKANPEAVMRAAKAANAHEFILRFPEGYDTLVGERGQRLSGGERQRISIARAILKDPRILILDEATSSVDAETEAALQEAIERLVKGRTTIAIAHRFSTLRHANRLIVLEKGRLVESGTHEELLDKPEGLFKRLVDLQTRASQIVAVAG